MQADETSSTSARRETILVVDDEDLILRLARRILERAGYRVLTATDGEQALERFGATGADVDLVLLDRTLPRLPGAQVLARLRALRPELKVIISTGDGAASLEQFPGASLILTKPYLPDQLCARVREVLDGPRGG